MSKRTLGFILFVVGVVGILVSLGADVLGVGSYPGINWAQLLGAILSFIIAMVGGWMSQSKADTKK